MSFIAHANYVDDAAFTLTSTQSYETTMPLTNLKDRRLAKVARVTSGVTMTLRLDLTASPKPVRCIALLNMDLDLNKWWENASGGSMLWRADTTTPGGGNVVDTGVSWVDRNTEAMPRNFIVVFDAAVTARYWQITATMTGNESGRGQAGRFWMSDAWIFTDEKGLSGVDRGWSLTHVDPSIVRRSRGQQVYVDRKNRYRVLDLSLGRIPKELAFGSYVAPYTNDMRSMQEIIMTAGVSDEVIVGPRLYPYDETLGYNPQVVFNGRTALYGTLTGAPKLVHSAADMYELRLQVQEAR